MKSWKLSALTLVHRWLVKRHVQDQRPWKLDYAASPISTADSLPSGEEVSILTTAIVVLFHRK
jgi:hypothetical protein